MKRLLIAGAALGLALAGPAVAEQDHHHDHNGTHGSTSSASSSEGASGTHFQYQGGQTGHATVNQPMIHPQVVTQPPVHTETGHMTVMGHGAMFTGNPSRNHIDFSKFHRNFQASRHFHINAYHRPQGWYVHRWVFGERLPPAFFARDYWLADWAMFGLMPPPDGCVWVRVGDDALLIDEYDGEVVQVVYGLFD